MISDSAVGERRKQTINSVYRCLYEAREGRTKAELAERLGLSLPTIYQSLSGLMDSGLVRCIGEQQSTGGRRAQSIGIVPDARVSVGLSITEDRIRMVLTDLYLNELSYRSVPYDAICPSGAFARILADLVEAFLDDSGTDREKLLGIGIAFPGMVTENHTRSLYSPTLGIKDASLDGLIQHIPYPVFWENDAICGGKAEMFARGENSTMAYLSLENGVGGAVLIDGKPYVGKHMRSGEFGHMCVAPAGLPCSCGKQGCLEAYCSAQRIRGNFGVSLQEFFDGLSQHIPEYEMLWNDLLLHLAIGINNIRMALDCDVVLGGFLTEYIAPYLPQLKAYVASCNPFSPDGEYVHLSVLRRHTVPLGAALSFIQKFLDHV